MDHEVLVHHQLHVPKKIGGNSLVQVVMSDLPTIHFTEFFPFFSTVQNFETQC